MIGEFPYLFTIGVACDVSDFSNAVDKSVIMPCTNLFPSSTKLPYGVDQNDTLSPQQALTDFKPVNKQAVIKSSSVGMRSAKLSKCNEKKANIMKKKRTESLSFESMQTARDGGLWLDTLAVTSHVRDVLQTHNFGQKLFGRAVLGLSQGSVSELLSKPKPWHLLGPKGREPFIKMHLWLSDPNGIEGLREFEHEHPGKLLPLIW